MSQRFSITPSRAAVDTDLTDSEHRTLAVIGMFGDANGWCWPSQSTIAEARGITRKTVNLHVKRLIDLGYLNIHKRYDEETGAQKSNMMQIRFDFPPDVTGGVTSLALQGGGSPERYTPPNIQDVTHNDPINDPIKDLYKRTPEYLPEPVHQLITALSAISKTPYWPKTELDYSDAAYFLVGIDAKVEDVPKFSIWWEQNGYYQGKPALKTIVDEWQNFAGGHSTNGNGKSNGAPDLWLTDGLPYRVGSKRFTDLDPKSQQAIRQMGGQSVFKAGGQFEETRLRSQFLQLVTVTQ